MSWQVIQGGEFYWRMVHSCLRRGRGSVPRVDRRRKAHLEQRDDLRVLTLVIMLRRSNSRQARYHRC